MNAIFKHELSSYFKSMTAYVFGAFLLMWASVLVWFNHLVGASVEFHRVMAGMAYILIIVVPLLTMNVIAEERRQKTDQLLYSLPISMTDVVVGKYLAILVTFIVPMAFISMLPLIFSSYGQLNLRMAYCAELGFLLAGAALLAIGVFVSSMTESQSSSAGMCFVVMIVNFFLEDFAALIPTSAVVSLLLFTILALLIAFITQRLTKNMTLALAVATILEAANLVAYLIKPDMFQGLFAKLLLSLSVFGRLENIYSGEFDIGSVVFYLSLVGVFLFLTVQSMEKRRWSE